MTNDDLNGGANDHLLPDDWDEFYAEIEAAETEAARIAAEVAACDAEQACIGNEEARIEAANDAAQWLRDHEAGEGAR